MFIMIMITCMFIKSKKHAYLSGDTLTAIRNQTLFRLSISLFTHYSSIFFLVTWFNDIIHQALNHTCKASWFPLLFQLVTIRISSINSYSTSLVLSYSTNLVILQCRGEHSPANKNCPSPIKLILFINNGAWAIKLMDKCKVRCRNPESFTF